jgi:predicted nuclease of predicted toxin-antitoxin system
VTEKVRFFLDECVDEGVCRELRKFGYICWTVHDARRDQLADLEQMVYADNKNAVMVSHDKDFRANMKARTFGRFVHLGCANAEAVDMVHKHHAELVQMLTLLGEGVYQMEWTGVTYVRGHPL